MLILECNVQSIDVSLTFPRGTLLCCEHIPPTWGPWVLNSAEANALKSLPGGGPPCDPCCQGGEQMTQEEDTPNLTNEANCNMHWEEFHLILSFLILSPMSENKLCLI